MTSTVSGIFRPLFRSATRVHLVKIQSQIDPPSAAWFTIFPPPSGRLRAPGLTSLGPARSAHRLVHQRRPSTGTIDRPIFFSSSSFPEAVWKSEQWPARGSTTASLVPAWSPRLRRDRPRRNAAASKNTSPPAPGNFCTGPGRDVRCSDGSGAVSLDVSVAQPTKDRRLNRDHAGDAGPDASDWA